MFADDKPKEVEEQPKVAISEDVVWKALTAFILMELVALGYLIMEILRAS